MPEKSATNAANVSLGLQCRSILGLAIVTPLVSIQYDDSSQAFCSLLHSRASPRIYPRPSYPPVAIVLTSIVRDILFQAGVLGTVFSYLLFPLYTFTRQLAVSHGISDNLYFSIMVSGVHTFLYLTVNLTFESFDHFGLYQQYKLDRKPYMIPTSTLLSKMYKEASIGQLFTGPVAAYYLYDLFAKFGMSGLDGALPDARDLMRSFIIAHIFNDVFFYITHRAFHTQFLYKNFHKQHHTFTGTIGFAAEYAHPVEVIISNQVPTIGGVLLFPTHPLVVLIWLAFRLQQTYEAHSGYAFLGHWSDKLWLSHGESAVFHDHHHTSNSGNFGSVYSDFVFGTMDVFMSKGGTEGYVNEKLGKVE